MSSKINPKYKTNFLSIIKRGLNELLKILLYGKFEINSHNQTNNDKNYPNIRIKR